METPQHQGIYVPLSQRMSDSESEEELHNIVKSPLQKAQNQDKKEQLVRQNKSPFDKEEPRRIPPNSLNLKSKSIDQNHRKLQIEHQRKSEEISQSQKKIENNKLHNNSWQEDTVSNMQNLYLRSVIMSDIGINSESGGPCDAGSNFSSFNSDYDEHNQTEADDVAILGYEESTKHCSKPMSPARRCCFIASLLLCFLTITIFVYIIPCNDHGSCPAATDRVRTHNWLNNYTKIEFKGGVNIVSGARSWENNLIFLYRGDNYFPEFRVDNSKRNGIIALIGSSGAVAWFNQMTDEPIAIDCTLLDIDLNMRPDCLVIDEYGELGAFHPVSGQWYWRHKERSFNKIDSFDFPIILPDIDNDGVMDLLLATSTSSNDRNKQMVVKGEWLTKNNQHAAYHRNCLRIISGRSGKVVGEEFKVHECDTIRRLQLENGLTVSFTCLRNNTDAQRSYKLFELFALITNKNVVNQQKLAPASKIAQHRHYGQRKDIDSQRNIYSLSGRELVIENRGKCPEDCNVTFILSENRNGKVYVLRNFTNSAVYGMIPTQLHFRNTSPNISGFVMKFWKWNNPRNENDEPDKSKANNSHRSNETFQKAQSKKSKPLKPTAKGTATNSNKSKHFEYMDNKRNPRSVTANSIFSANNKGKDFDIFKNVIEKRNIFSIKEKKIRSKRSTQYANVTNLIDNYKIQIITESVILILFIGSDTRIENTSQSNIIQFCKSDNNEIICQPDLSNQENSMVIADLDQDGSQELVSYMSTFNQPNESNPADWRLVTYVRLLRLQSELPEFYKELKMN